MARLLPWLAMRFLDEVLLGLGFQLDRHHAASLSNEAAVLELLRLECRDAVELGLGAVGPRLGSCAGPAIERPDTRAQQGHLQGSRHDRHDRRWRRTDVTSAKSGGLTQAMPKPALPSHAIGQLEVAFH